MKKSIAALGVAIAAAISLAACGGGSTPNINANLHYDTSLGEYCSTYACYPPGWTPGS